ncbi:MAG: histidine phosphatase family protein [Planctomycetota bacterium]
MTDHDLLPRRALLGLGLGLGAGALLPAARAQDSRPTTPVAGAAPLLVYAVRHAEKESKGRDPALTEAGRTRAAALARMLADVPIEAVYSTDTLRTRGTAKPLCDAKQLEPQLYEPGRLARALVAGKARTVLVVGHSNTVPGLMAGLGGKPPAQLLSGYDDLFLAIVLPGGTVLQQLHFGPPSRDSGH